MKTLNVGVLGTGGMGKTHTTSFMKNPKCKVIAACSRDIKSAEDFANGKWREVTYGSDNIKQDFIYKIQYRYDDYREMAQNPEIDAVSITSPNGLHYDMAKTMLEAGKHVIVEKPMTATYEEARNLVKIAKERSLLIATGHMWRYHADVNFVKSLVEKGLLGDIVQTKSYGIHKQWGPSGWFIDSELAAGGALIDMGVHAIDTTMYILGNPEISSVYASVANKFGNYEVDDFAQIYIKHKNGVVSLIESGWNYPYSKEDEASTEVMGTNGYARLFPTFADINIDGYWVRMTPQDQEGNSSTLKYTRMIDNFIDACLGLDSCKVAYDVGAKVMRIVEAAYTSAKDNEIIRWE